MKVQIPNKLKKTFFWLGYSDFRFLFEIDDQSKRKNCNKPLLPFLGKNYRQINQT